MSGMPRTTLLSLAILLLRMLSVRSYSDSINPDPKRLIKCRDGTLVALAELFNSHAHLFSDWTDSEQNHESFTSMLGHWIVAPPCGHPPLNKTKHDENVDCANERYSGALTGKRLDSARLVVDFVLFGYDVEKLEIRLHETYDLVDVFVIQESSVTMFMYPKPVLLPTLLTDPRFAPFLDKIVPIHVSKDELPEGINGDAVDHWFRNSIVQKFFALESTGNPLVAKVVSALRAHGLSGSIDNNDEDTSYSAWFWKSIVRIFYALVSMGSPLAAEGVSSLSGSYPIGLQNDADEVVSYSALSHVKHCELRPEIDEYGVQFPSFSFKKNFHWVQETYDMQCLQGSSFQSNSSMILKAYMWRPGPFAWPLYKMNVHADNLLRVYDMSDAYCTLNMGLGAAVHMSSVAEPAEVWMKRVGTQDGIGLRLQPAFLRAARAGAVTPELIFLETMYPSCVGGEAKFQHFHIGSMGSHVEAKVMSHLPLVVRKHPGRYPFLLPGHPVNAKRHKLIKQASEVRWKENMCSLPSAKELLYTTSLTS